MTMRIGWRQRGRGIVRFLRNCGGATPVEYGLIAVLVADGMLAGALGAGNSSSWSNTSNKITNAKKDRAP